MSVEDIALLREIARWCRGSGPWPRVDYYARPKGDHSWSQRADLPGLPYQAGRGAWVALEVRDTDDPGDAYAVLLYSKGSPVSDKIEVRSVTQAVDLLVALGFLPQRFSSAYRAGWHAAWVWETGLAPQEEFKRLFHDPDNTSFPAGEYL